jgi:phage terminase large subunit-like protein
VRSRSSKAGDGKRDDRAGWPALVLRGIAYAERVVSGEIVAGRYVRLACHRFLADLKAAERARATWRFDPERAVEPMRLAELLPNIKGPQAGRPIRLMDWQCWIFSNLFGFVDRKTGDRRFRQACVYCPRGNGKTSMAAPIALYLTFLEGEGGAEGYAAAVTRDQAKILWDVAKAMVDRTPALSSRFGVATSRNSIYQPSTSSKFVSISSDAKALDGLNVHVAVCDEIASHRTANVYDVLLTALGKRAQPLLLSISTATGNNAGIGRKIHDYTQKVLEGSLKDERFFGVIYAADMNDPVWEESTWIKANPGWGVTVQPDAIRAIANQARASPAQEIAFKTRHLNLWTSADTSLFLMEAWHRCRKPSLRLEDFEGMECYAGIDLSSKIDMTSACLIFPIRTAGEPTRYAIFSRSWLPEATVEGARNASYPEWARTGALTVTEGEVIDFDAVESFLLEAADRFDLRSVGYDPWSAKQLAQRMTNAGVPMVEVRQTVMNLSEPTKELDALMRSGRIAHDGNPVLAWAISCVIGRYDEKGNVFPKKDRNSDNKIDAAIAAIIAVAMATAAEQKTVHLTESPLMLI